MLSPCQDINVATMEKAAGLQKDMLTKEANSIPAKTQTLFVEKPQDGRQNYDGMSVGSTKSSLKAMPAGNVNRSGFTFNSSNLGKNGDEETLEYDSSLDNASASSFDFYNDRADNRPAVGPLSKPAPSKWDDAEKWLVSVPSVQTAPLKSKSKGSVLQVAQVVNSQAALNPGKKASSVLGQVRKCGNGHAPRAMPVVNGLVSNSPEQLETLLPPERITSEGREHLLDNVSKSSVEWMKKVDTARYISEQGERAAKFSFTACENQYAKLRPLPYPIDRYALSDAFECGYSDFKEPGMSSIGVDDEILKPTLRTEKPIMEVPKHDNLLTFELEPSSSPHEASYLPPPNLRSVSMRDMGTEMTPLASQEPSRTGTPNRATTPTPRSPISSHPSTPGRAVPGPSPKQQRLLVNGLSKESELMLPEPPEKDLQAKTKQEILALGTQLGKANIAAWATREEEDVDASKYLKNIDLGEMKKKVLETRAAAWEEAETAKYMARYEHEEAKIQAWENHERAKAEAEMKRIEVKVERMRSLSHERLMNKLAIARRRSEEMRAAAEARRAEQAAKTAQHAELIRQTGKMPFSFHCCNFCW
ncbi:hypothetical protein O6H91_12G044300 [Diphasiastrum complanatum]|uniref:Uncharacterized protein n=2 Tax=Diphasiastrum complanatum TaxID=34168 RepID=A0ACC2C1D5_DIPCM|nr:hypothetical protein O6H91_12G044300 [Diphasiastrum complanatum]KAJ7535747.1 hypothetical protein O6H91_12G044300 [Diphasiastrum complanatum]